MFGVEHEALLAVSSKLYQVGERYWCSRSAACDASETEPPETIMVDAAMSATSFTSGTLY